MSTKNRSVMDLVAFLWMAGGICMFAAIFTEGALALLGLGLICLGAVLAFGRIKDWW